MDSYDLDRAYYAWLTDMLPSLRQSYSRLLWKLFDTPFVPSLPMDRNRLGDGLSLRDRFIWERKGGCSSEADRNWLAAYTRPCSMLEMMIALALRCEEEYMTGYTDLDPVGQWFHPMLYSLQLSNQTDGRFDPIAVDCRLRDFMQRKYQPNGLGGLFYIPDCREDLRQVEIWYQAMTYLTYFKGGNKNE